MEVEQFSKAVGLGIVLALFLAYAYHKAVSRYKT